MFPAMMITLIEDKKEEIEEKNSEVFFCYCQLMFSCRELRNNLLMRHPVTCITLSSMGLIYFLASVLKCNELWTKCISRPHKPCKFQLYFRTHNSLQPLGEMIQGIRRKEREWMKSLSSQSKQIELTTVRCYENKFPIWSQQFPSPRFSCRLQNSMIISQLILANFKETKHILKTFLIYS